MNERFKKFVSICCIIFFLPFLITLIMNREQALVLLKEVTIQDYLATLVYLDLPQEYVNYNEENLAEANKKIEEFIKAQIVVTRTNAYYRCKTESIEVVIQEASTLLKRNLHNVYFQKKLNYIGSIIEDMDREVLNYQGNIVEAPFHKVSGGTTRTGVEVYQNKAYDYLTGVDSPKDVESSDYLKGHFFSPESLFELLIVKYPDSGITKEQIGEQMKVEKVDSAQYVLTIRIGNQLVSGEELRKLLELSSSNFTVQSYKDGIRFLCKGLGHGLGMSQYGGKELSKGGATYQDILKYYFPSMTLDRIKEQ